MYRLDPLVDSTHKIELPSCMYQVENIHNEGTVSPHRHPAHAL